MIFFFFILHYITYLDIGPYFKNWGAGHPCLFSCESVVVIVINSCLWAVDNTTACRHKLRPTTMGLILSQLRDVFQAGISSEAEDPQWLLIRYPWTGFVCPFVYLCLFSSGQIFYSKG